MNQKNQRVFKFVRKQYQTSDQINPKKNQEQRKSRPISKQQEKLRQHINYFAPPDHIVQQKIDQPNRVQSKKVQFQNNKNNQSKIVFDKSLVRVVMPDQFEKIRFIKKIQNRLFSCLEKKKPQIPVKKLMNSQSLNAILGRKQRTIITKNGYNQHLDGDAESMKQIQGDLAGNNRSSRKFNQNEPIIRIKEGLSIFQEEFKPKYEQNQKINIFQPQRGLSEREFDHQTSNIGPNYNYFVNFSDHQRSESKLYQYQKDNIKNQRSYHPFRQYQKDNNPPIMFNEVKINRNEKKSSSQIDLKNLKVPKLQKQEGRELLKFNGFQSIEQQEFQFADHDGSNKQKSLFHCMSDFVNHDSGSKYYRR